MGEPQEEVWVFGGLRILSGRKRIVTWINPELEGEDREKWFKASGPMPVVGAEYRATVTRRDGGGVTLHGKPEFIGPHPDAELRAELEARHRAADARWRLIAMENSAKRSSALDEALEPLLELARKLPPGDQDAFAMYVLRKIRRSPF